MPEPSQQSRQPNRTIESPSDLPGLASTNTAFRELLESAPDGIVIVDGGSRIVLVNRQAEKLFGYQRDQLLGQPIEVLLPERFRAGHQHYRDDYQQVPRTRPMGAGLDLWGRRQDGTEFPVEISLSPMTLDGERFVISIVRDITERKRLEREREELLASVTYVLDGVSDAVVALDTQGRVIRVNPAACELLGCAHDQLVGRAAHDVFRWEDEAGRLLDEDEYVFQQSLASGHLASANNRYFRKPDGARIPVAVNSAPVVTKDRGVEMVVQVIRDISREREIEELKNQIISLVSHELRTPIGHIKGFSSSLLDPEVKWDADTQLDFITEIDREADRLSALVRDLLDMSKIESGTAMGEKVEVSPAAVTRQAMKDVENATAQHHVINEVREDLPDVLGDSGQLERVIGNLIENAAKYSPPETTITIHAEPDHGNVRWSVTDQGPGIPIEYRQRIFEKFVRVRTGPSRIPGTGLGLPICKGIVEAHGGRLWLESPSEGGSRFLFTIPRAGP
ncbi:MAG TPA: PAS domain S-box protein [Chloroflexota bacterium]|nr:PAS domain S-box protein [Chloroflexota bacterium]